MALYIGDRVEGTLERARWRAKDAATGADVAINISHEALTDKGETACLDKAMEKYDGLGNSVGVTTGGF